MGAGAVDDVVDDVVEVEDDALDSVVVVVGIAERDVVFNIVEIEVNDAATTSDFDSDKGQVLFIKASSTPYREEEPKHKRCGDEVDGEIFCKHC